MQAIKTQTKGDIERLGDLIRSQRKNLDENTLNLLQTYRISHKDALSDVFNILCHCSKQIRNDAIVTYRIKRIESIIGKLDRYPKMQFDRMWDIAGCRCILKSDSDVYRLYEKLKTKLYIRKVKDYIKEAQPEGYRSLHLFVSKTISDDKIIEVQLRNQNHHNWATLVEITDFLFDERLKECESNSELLRFHFLLSQKNILSEKEKCEIFKIIKKYNYLEKLSSVFTRNYLSVRKQWMNIEGKINQTFFLIEAKKDEPPKIDSFYSFTEAEAEYFNRFKISSNSNIVLTNIQKASYKQVSIAYSNYILTVHQFIDDCFDMLEGLIIQSVRNKKIFEYARYYGLYSRTVVSSINNLNSEILTIDTYYKKNPRNAKVKEWVNDINDQLRRRQEKSERLRKLFNKNGPRTIFSNLFFFIVTYFITSKYKRRIK